MFILLEVELGHPRSWLLLPTSLSSNKSNIHTLSSRKWSAHGALMERLCQVQLCSVDGSGEESDRQIKVSGTSELKRTLEVIL